MKNLSKKSFILFQEYENHLSLLTSEQKGQLFDAIFKYNRGVDVKLEPIVYMAFSFMKADLDRNSESWEETKREKSKSGKIGNLKRWHKDLYDEFQEGGLTLDEALAIAKGRKVSHSDNSESLKSQAVANIAVNEDVNVNVNVNVNEKEKNKAKKDLSILIESHFDIFWNTYIPNKVDGKFTAKGSREKSLQNYSKIVSVPLKKGSDEIFSEIQKGTEDYIKYCYDNRVWTKGVEAFLNNKIWKNDYETQEVMVAPSSENKSQLDSVYQEMINYNKMKQGK